jgi:predicted PurR-regulated permease PerM
MTGQQVFRNTLIVLATVTAAYVLLLSIRIVIALLVAIIIASAVLPMVNWLQKRGLSQGLSIILVYLLLALSLFALAVLIVPPAVNRLAEYVTNEDRLANRLITTQAWAERNLERLTRSEDIELVDPDNIRSTVSQATREFVAAFPVLAGEIGSLLGYSVLTFVMGVYWLTSRREAITYVESLFPLGRRTDVDAIIYEIESSLGAYVRGVALVVTFVGIANTLLLTLFRVPNPVMLGVIIGLTTALPVVGGFIGAGAAVLLALLGEPIHAVLTFVSFALVQQIETNYLTPRVMSRSVKLNPILVIVFIFVGFALGGVLGGMLAIPVSGTMMILIRHLIIEPMKEEVTPTVVQGAVLLTSKEPMPKPP